MVPACDSLLCSNLQPLAQACALAATLALHASAGVSTCSARLSLWALSTPEAGSGQLPPLLRWGRWGGGGGRSGSPWRWHDAPPLR